MNPKIVMIQETLLSSCSPCLSIIITTKSILLVTIAWLVQFSSGSFGKRDLLKIVNFMKDTEVIKLGSMGI